jgi:UDP-N-acetylglucosamine 2-epimerase (non-hydrolysing)
MIDTLVALRPRLGRSSVLGRLGLEPTSYLLVTLHRPALVDGPLLEPAMAALASVSRELPVVFPLHPRTRARLAESGVDATGVTLIEPVGYLDFLALQASAAAVLTDSGGVQEETTFLGVPCFTLRANTERPITVNQGTNRLLGLRPEAIEEIPRWLRAPARRPGALEGWDGRAAARVADELLGDLPGALKRPSLHVVR